LGYRSTWFRIVGLKFESDSTLPGITSTAAPPDITACRA
jgi:hypothetical protein